MANIEDTSEPGSPPAPSAKRSGAIAIAEALRASGIELVFGYAGGGTNALIDGIAKAGPPTMSARTEISAAWMSYAYNKARGRAASAVLVHCVGALHASPVVYAAKVDGTPLVLMTVTLDSSVEVREALQDAREVSAALKPISKYSAKLHLADDLPLAVRQAVIAASTGRPGSSVLDFAFQALTGETDCPAELLTLPLPPAASAEGISRAIEMIGSAERPILFVGSGVHKSRGAEELVAFAEATGVPVVSTSWGGRGLMPDSHPLFSGVMGSFGWINANELAQRSDLWIAIGTSFSQMTTAAWNIEKPSHVIQIDVDPNQIGKIFQPTLGIVADAREALRQLRDAAAAANLTQAHSLDSMEELRRAKTEWFAYQDELAAEAARPINQYHLIQALNRTIPAGSIVVGDSGMHAFMLYRAYRYLETTPQVHGSRYQSMGSGLPLAIGAKIAFPDRQVVCLHGDGGIYFDIADLSMLSEHGLKVILVIDDNAYLAANRSSAMIMKLQNPWVGLPATVDFVTVAKGFGVPGERVEDPTDLEAALLRALAADTSYVIDVVTDPDTRIKRAVKDVVPIISDRIPQAGGEGHVSPTTRRSWPK